MDMKHNKGFTLVELMIAIVIFAIGIVGAAKLQMAAVASNIFSQQVGDAVNIAEDNIERLKTLSLSSASFDVGNHTGTQITTELGRTFNPTWTVTEISGSRARNITVTVSWQEKGFSHTTTLSFIKGDNE